MPTSSFLTRIESHRDPKALWPLAAIASVVAHGAMLAALRPLTITLQPPPETDPSPIPIQLLAGTPNPDVATTPQPPELPTIAPTVTAPPTDLVSPTTTTPAPDLPTITPPTPTPPTPPPRVDPPPSPPVTQPPVTQPPVTQPPIPPPSVEPPPVEPPPVTQPPVTAPPTDGSTGQVSPLGLQAAPFGRDFPDVPPRLTSNASLSVQPWLSVCGVSNLGAIASPGTLATVTLQLQVEASGEVSFARVIESSGSAAIDNLVSCMVRRQLRLEPAQVAGQPFVTDAYLLQTQVQF